MVKNINYMRLTSIREKHQGSILNIAIAINHTLLTYYFIAMVPTVPRYFTKQNKIFGF